VKGFVARGRDGTDRLETLLDAGQAYRFAGKLVISEGAADAVKEGEQDDSAEPAAIRERRKMPMQSRPKTTQAMRITRRSLELLSEEVGIRAKIKDRTVTTVAAPTSGQTQDLTRLIGEPSKSDDEAGGS
jgi:hypothetical protein